MSESIVAISINSGQLEACIDELKKDLDIPLQEISVLLPDAEETETSPDGSEKEIIGSNGEVQKESRTGGIIGMLAGIGTLAIHGFGVFVAAGPLMTALHGSATGATGKGVMGTLMGFGIPEDKSRIYEDRLRRGQYLIAVHADNETRRQAVSEVMVRHKLDNIFAFQIID